MKYLSTRDFEQKRISAAKAIVAGLAADGGLYVPCDFPRLQEFIGLPYNEMALQILRLFLTDYTEDELKNYVSLAYDGNLPVNINKDYLELFHGRTAAFKDVALQLFPHLLTAALRKCGEKRTAVILTATSGDTGSAVLAGISDVHGTRAIVFYPAGGVSDIQRLQMVTQTGDNLNVFGIKGNFDDAQTAVKEIFADADFQKEFLDANIFTSANSINLGRLLPQIVYYFYCYSELVGAGRIKQGEPINFVVPTGNFGNILAGYYARKMGLPVKKLICASNQNNVLYDFITKGIYDRRRDFGLTLSPSMDILISSNLERFIYDLGGCDLVVKCYGDLRMQGVFSVGSSVLKMLNEMFDADFATDLETVETIKRVYETSGYVLDPHTAVARCVYEKYKQRTGDETISIILATANPHKFPETMERAIGKALNNPPASLKDLNKKTVLHGEIIGDVRQSIAEVLR